jgi:uncharacterized membrane protein YvbJ
VFCPNCGSQLIANASFCSKCGSATKANLHAIRQARAGNSNYSIASFICGGIAFLLLPIIFGPAGIIFGAIAKSKNEKNSTAAILVSSFGLVIGMILGVLAWRHTFV